MTPFLIFARRHWRVITELVVLVILLVALGLTKLELRGARSSLQTTALELRLERANHRITIANVRLARAQALADDLAHAAEVKRRDDAIAREAEHDLQSKLDAARRDADAYARRLRARGGPAGDGAGGGGEAHHAATPDAAGDADGTGASAELDDARICAEAVVKAEGWQEWWRKVSAAPR